MLTASQVQEIEQDFHSEEELKLIADWREWAEKCERLLRENTEQANTLADLQRKIEAQEKELQRRNVLIDSEARQAVDFKLQLDRIRRCLPEQSRADLLQAIQALQRDSERLNFIIRASIDRDMAEVKDYAD